MTALGVKREEKALGYAVQKVSGDELGTVKTTFVGTALTGKVAGLQVRNSTEFGSAPTLRIRGESPLLVVDGVPYEYVALSELVADDIESIDVLKGASASALYGAKGGSGAVMVTTKKAKKEGLDVSVNSSLMADVGFLAFPDVQTQYSSGAGGKYLLNDAVWGDKLDIGRTATLYNPYTYENEPDQPLVSRGRNNFENFLQTSFVANNTVSIAYKGKLGSFRTSVNHIYNRGQYPNTKLNKTNYSLNGDLKYKRFSLSAGLTYNYATYPNNYGTGYGKGSYIYNLVIFQGTEYDIRDFRNYWVKPDEQQNWVVNGSWYDNPYFLANENTHGDKQHLVNGYLTLGYDLTSWLKLSARTGVDAKNGRQEWREAWSSAAAPRSGESHKKGYYEIQKRTGFSINQDVMFTADKTWGGFGLNVMAGMNAFYRSWDTLSGYTQGGLSIPGYYSLKASVNPALAASTMSRRRSMSLYGKATLSWKSMAYVDVTARNDWSSTLPAESRSYFYPSVAGSFILTEVLPKMRGVDLLKVRGSWTRTKMDLGVYDIDRSYTISADRWGGMSGADYPDKIRGSVNPETKDAYEVGVAGIFFGNRLRADVTYYQTLSYDFVKDGTVSNASGFTHKKINTKEELLRRGAEVMLSATPRQNEGLAVGHGRQLVARPLLLPQARSRILERFAVGVRRSALGLDRHSGLGARSRRQYRPRQQRTSGAEPVQVQARGLYPRLDMGLDQHRQVEELYAFVLVRRTCGRHRFLDDRPGAVERRFASQIGQPVPLRRGCERSQDLRGPRCEGRIGQRGLRRLRTHPARRPGLCAERPGGLLRGLRQGVQPDGLPSPLAELFRSVVHQVEGCFADMEHSAAVVRETGTEIRVAFVHRPESADVDQGVQIQRSRLHRPFDRRGEPLVSVAPPDRL